MLLLNLQGYCRQPLPCFLLQYFFPVKKLILQQQLAKATTQKNFLKNLLQRLLSCKPLLIC